MDIKQANFNTPEVWRIVTGWEGTWRKTLDIKSND